jgi:hypothetical protein
MQELDNSHYEITTSLFPGFYKKRFYHSTLAANKKVVNLAFGEIFFSLLF